MKPWMACAMTWTKIVNFHSSPHHNSLQHSEANMRVIQCQSTSHPLYKEQCQKYLHIPQLPHQHLVPMLHLLGICKIFNIDHGSDSMVFQSHIRVSHTGDVVSVIITLSSCILGHAVQAGPGRPGQSRVGVYVNVRLDVWWIHISGGVDRGDIASMAYPYV